MLDENWKRESKSGTDGKLAFQRYCRSVERLQYQVQMSNSEQSSSSNYDPDSHQSYLKKHLNSVDQGQIFGDPVSKSDQDNYSLQSSCQNQQNVSQRNEEVDNQAINSKEQMDDNVNEQVANPEGQQQIGAPIAQQQVIGHESWNRKGYYRLDGADEQGQEIKKDGECGYSPYISDQLKEYIELMKNRQNKSLVNEKNKEIKFQQKIERQPVMIGGSDPAYYGIVEKSKEKKDPQKDNQQQELQKQQQLPNQQKKHDKSLQYKQPHQQCILDLNNNMDDQPFQQPRSQNKNSPIQPEQHPLKRLKENYSSLISQQQLSIFSQNIVNQMRGVVREVITSQRQSNAFKDKEIIVRLENTIKESVKIQMGEFQREYNKQMRDQSNMLRELMKMMKRAERRYQKIEEKLGIQPLQQEEEY